MDTNLKALNRNLEKKLTEFRRYSKTNGEVAKKKGFLKSIFS